MEIDKLTLGEIKEVAKLIGIGNQSKTRDYGYAIVVADRGFVYIGNVVVNNDFASITEGKNIRSWGTKKGLGQLVNEGPQKETSLDICGEIDIPMRAVISIHKTDKTLWLKS
jgi:hypothetical protein